MVSSVHHYRCKPADQASIYFACVNFFFFNLRQIISLSTGPIFTIFSPNERYLREFSRYGPLFYSFRDVAMATDFGQNLQSDLYVQHAGISQRIRILQFRLRGDKGHNFCYFLCNFCDDWSTNCKDLAGSFCTFWDETAKIHIIIPNISASTANFTNFSALVQAHVWGLKTEIISALVEETLL